MFGRLESVLHSELGSLGHSRAALLGLAAAEVAPDDLRRACPGPALARGGRARHVARAPGGAGVWIAGSRDHRAFEDYLLPAEPAGAPATAIAGETDPERYVAAQASLLHERLQSVAACAARGELDGVEIEDGSLYIARTKPTVPDAARLMAGRLYGMLPRVRVTEVVSDVAQATGFAACFAHLFAKLHREVLAVVKEDPVCRRLMTVPGVGALVSLTYRAAVDDPGRFAKSKSVGAFFGLTPKRYQSGETDVTGGITKIGDASVRVALHDAATALLSRVTRFSKLKRWAMDVAKRRGLRRAKVALARKLATVLHRIWADGTEFVWGKDPATADATTVATAA